ncbi:MAG TPA: aspartyl protease family protein [Steroidobacteraceae bacterium]|jgi:tetratricopeptide (TPR) repeat protein|nr:aspartyl protease family protein [Steroidobacteraceae bacterium]
MTPWHAARALVPALGLAGLMFVPAGALAKCSVGKIAELPVTMRAMKPLVSAKINGASALFVADSGAFYSLITPASAAAYDLELRSAPTPITISGIGGTSKALLTTVKNFTLADIPLSNVDFIVGGNDPGSGAIGYLGQNVLQVGDVEYDLANGVIRLMRPDDCRRAMMAYWVQPPQSFSVVDIKEGTPIEPHTRGVAYVNGKRIRVMFDTGAMMSILTLRAAERAGVTPQTAGAEPAGLMRGVGTDAIQTWIAPFASFKIGDEDVPNAKLRIGDLRLGNADMLIGADFFLSHRIYVANEQRKLYFTYNGGPVFNLEHTIETSTAAALSAPSEEPTDAAGFARRGAAFAARNNYKQAIADLTRACEMDPTEPQYFYDRGLARVNNNLPTLAMSDFNEALKLRPEHVGARVARAQLRVAARDGKSAIADLDAADKSAAKEADIRLQMGNLYARAGSLEPAVRQFTLWLETHDRDGRKADVLAGRCRARALLNTELDQALNDCNVALKLRPDTPEFLDNRGLVRLRRGEFERAVADYDLVVQREPDNAWALYARGLGKLRQGDAAAGQADIAAATAKEPRIAEEAKYFGLAP